VAKQKTVKRNQKPTRTSLDVVAQYAHDVIAGRIVAGPDVRNACRRHLKDLEHGPSRGIYWDWSAAQRAIDFFPDVLRLSAGQFEGKPFELHVSQKFIVGSLFGWKRQDGARRFRRAYIEIAKGNGKSPLAAGIGLYLFLADGEARAEVYAAAADKDQAMVLFRDAVAMAQQSPAIMERVLLTGGSTVHNIGDPRSGSFFRPISREKRRSGSGPRPSCALCDEVHEHPDGLMVEMLERGFKWRSQPLLLMTTNSGSDPNSVCGQEHLHAVRVAAGAREVDDDKTFVGDVIDDEAFSFVCGLDKDDDPLNDETCWAKANPLLGVTVQPGYIQSVVNQAKAIPGKLNGILRLHFCVWTDAEVTWMSRETLEPLLVEKLAPKEEERIWLGVDLSATQDLTALGIVREAGTNDKGEKLYEAWIEAWTPEETMKERAERDQAPYETWVRQGYLNTTPGKLIKFEFMAAKIAELGSEYRIASLAYDAYGFKKHFEPELDRLGLTLPIVEHPQGGKRRAAESGLWMPGSKMILENLMLEGRIRFKRNPVLISAIMSAVVEEDPFGNGWFSKRKAVNRIDPLISLAMAMGAAAEDAAGSYLDEEEMLVI